MGGQAVADQAAGHKDGPKVGQESVAFQVAEVRQTPNTVRGPDKEEVRMCKLR
jgi:hypothetical protein